MFGLDLPAHVGVALAITANVEFAPVASAQGSDTSAVQNTTGVKTLIIVPEDPLERSRPRVNKYYHQPKIDAPNKQSEDINSPGANEKYSPRKGGYAPRKRYYPRKRY